MLDLTSQSFARRCEMRPATVDPAVGIKQSSQVRLLDWRWALKNDPRSAFLTRLAKTQACLQKEHSGFLIVEVDAVAPALFYGSHRNSDTQCFLK